VCVCVCVCVFVFGSMFVVLTVASRSTSAATATAIVADYGSDETKEDKFSLQRLGSISQETTSLVDDISQVQSPRSTIQSQDPESPRSTIQSQDPERMIGVGVHAWVQTCCWTFAIPAHNP
jgi:hypothetical protein